MPRCNGRQGRRLYAWMPIFELRIHNVHLIRVQPKAGQHEWHCLMLGLGALGA